MKYTYDEIAKAKSIADEEINNTLSSILKHFDKETRGILNKFKKVGYIFNSEEEKQKLIEMFNKVKKEKDNSKYSEYITLEYEINGKFFDINEYIHRGRFATEQREKITQGITIEL